MKKHHAGLYWSIAGYEGSGGAGVLADLDTFRRLGARAAAAVTCVTAQGRGGVVRLEPVSGRCLWSQLECLLERGRPRAIKVGALGSVQAVETLARFLARPELSGVLLVLDPVLRASAGGALLESGAIPLLVRHLIPRADVITPNAPEASRLLGGAPVKGRAGRVRAAVRLLALGSGSVVLTGGDGRGPVCDVLACPGRVDVFSADRLPGSAPGTGCRFSSALACFLGAGKTLPRAVLLAAAFTRRYLAGRVGVNPRPVRN